MAIVTRRLYLPDGRPVTLGASIGRGGEAEVFHVKEDARLVAKMYHSALTAAMQSKLEVMISLDEPELRRISAWPTALLRDRHGGRIQGLVMPKVSGLKAVHVMCSPKSRKIEFPQASWAFLVHLAANLAIAFDLFHQRSVVIGDVNNHNILVSQQGTAHFIDCDSFQVCQGSHVYRCSVGVPTYTAPELQGLSLATTTRTPNHDCFGLGVLIFQLLFMGRHPFSGTHLGGRDLTIESAISERRFAYGSGAAQRQMKPPPASLSLGAVPASTQGLFERAFVNSTNRPSAAEWARDLVALKRGLVRCRQRPDHHYSGVVQSCPWCFTERQAGMEFFVVSVAAGAARMPDIDLVGIWKLVAGVESPGPAPPLPDLSSAGLKPRAKARDARQSIIAMRFAGILVAATTVLIAASGGPGLLILGGLGVGAAMIFGSAESRRRPLQVALQSARADVQSAQRRWIDSAGDVEFTAIMQRLEEARATYLDIPNQRLRELEQLRKSARERQLKAHLDSAEIEGASIPGIGPSRTATLASFGIETAADVNWQVLHSVPGIGPALRSNLCAWRSDVEARFRFNPSQAVSDRDRVVVEQVLETRRSALARELQSGPHALRQARQRAMDERAHLAGHVESACQRMRQAMADAGVRTMRL